MQKSPSLSESPTGAKKPSAAEAPQASAGRLSYEEQKELNKRLKKLERRVADCEAEIEQTEAAIAILEEKWLRLKELRTCRSTNSTRS